MLKLWGLIEDSFADSWRAEDLVRTPAARRGEADLSRFRTRSARRESGAPAPMPVVNWLFFDLFPLPRAVHVRSESRVYDQHDQTRDR